MNPESEIYMLRSLVSQKTGRQRRPVYLPNHEVERALTFNKVRAQFLCLYQRFWRKGFRPGVNNVILANSNKESGISAGIDTTAPAKIFLTQLIENN
jgi:hypothetical protein